MERSCDRCGKTISGDEIYHHAGSVLCEDCCMNAMSPARACDPWAVYTAKSFRKENAEEILTDRQKAIIDILGETGGIAIEQLAQRLSTPMPELERDIATLRHMEKLKGQMRDGHKILVLW